MPRSTNNRAIELPAWIKTELDARANYLGVTRATYAARLLEEALGIRPRPAA